MLIPSICDHYSRKSWKNRMENIAQLFKCVENPDVVPAY